MINGEYYERLYNLIQSRNPPSHRLVDSESESWFLDGVKAKKYFNGTITFYDVTRPNNSYRKLGDEEVKQLYNKLISKK